ncbi:MAG: hypothetical protein JW803_01440 [Endomicrobiales bacterium]|nr:hypothetical protein [Endomicrobiales bacterium]
MKKAENEFDVERIKIYMSQPTEAKLRFLEEANAFFEKAMDEKTKEISRKLRKKKF